jgi:hypothetical protein
MINTLRWYSGGWLLVAANWICDILDTLDPQLLQLRNPYRMLSFTAFGLFGVLPAFLMVYTGTLIVGKANVSRIDDIAGGIL